MAGFPTTQWGQIAEAGDRSSPGREPALSEICAAYWYPIYALIRSLGHSPDEAADLTQDFFARLLEGKLLGIADQSKGRFRDLLRRDCLHFLGDARDRAGAKKRGGDVAVLSLDVGRAEQRYGLEPSGLLDPERRFERAWAMGVLDRALERLSAREEDAGRGAGFRALLPSLTEDPDAPPMAIVAQRIGTTEGAAKAALRRLRAGYRDALREEVAYTLGHPTEAEVDEELRHLLGALGG
jgi:RNA polymerase sigma-70 factor (ECF subfamily)